MFVRFYKTLFFRRLISNLNFRPDFATDYLVNCVAFQVVEVKGPKDILSPKQKIWLSQFTEWNVDAELCKVVGKIFG